MMRLSDWLHVPDTHFYLRPLGGNVIFLDLDKFQGDMDLLMKLRPRAIVQTSEGNYSSPGKQHLVRTP